MDWGLYNDTYGDPWTLTYAGQFWTQISIGGHLPLTLSDREYRLSAEPPESSTLRKGEWIRANETLTQISSVFQLARNLASTFYESEVVQLAFAASNIRGKWLHFSRGDSRGPCKAPKLQRGSEMPAVDFANEWLDLFADIGKDFVDLFCRDGRVLSRDEVKQFCNSASNI